jgi:uncharacterized protein
MTCADRGHPGAQARLGKCHAEGQGVPRNPQEAVRLYQSAAAQNSAEGLTRLGEWYERSQCARMMSHSCVSVIVCSYESAFGVPYSEAEAYRLYSKAADLGFLEAKCAVARCMLRGHVCAKQPEAAIKLLNECISNGLRAAALELGRCYAQGDGVKADNTEALRLFQFAAEDGSANALANLGVVYQVRE